MAKILIIIPHDRFRDEELQTLTQIFKEKGHEVAIGSSHHTEAQGHFGMLVKPDIDVDFVEDEDYDGLVFIGGRGVEEYLMERSITNLIRDFFHKSKPLGALGMAVEILVYAGILSGRKVTCDNATIPKVQNAGAYYSGRLVEKDGQIVTGSGVSASADFAEEFSAALR